MNTQRLLFGRFSTNRRTIGAAVAALLFAGLAVPAAARDTIRLPGPSVFPEGIAVTADGTFYVGSAKGGAILRVPPGQTEAVPFIPPGRNGLNWVTGLIVDEARRRLYACSSDPGVGDLTGTTTPALAVFDAATGSTVARYSLPHGGFCNDMALAANGDLYVTDSLNPRILKLSADGDRLAEWLVSDRFTGEGFSLNGIAVEDDSALVVVKYNTGDLLRVGVAADGRPEAVTPITLPRPLAGPDGLERLAPGRFLVVEGGSGALTEIRLGATGASLRRLAAGMAAPTTVAVTGDEAWVVEGQLNLLFDPGKAGTAPQSFRVVRVPLSF